MSPIKQHQAARHVDAMLVAQGPSRAAGPSLGHLAGDEPVVYGEPIHAEAGSIVARYRRDSLGAFLAHEARFAVGNYALVESKHNSCRIITSPGYCGGYYHCRNGHAVAGTLLASVLAAASGKIEMDPFSLCFYLSHAPGSSFGQFPLTSMFKGVDRIPPASVIEFENGAPLACYSYLIEAVQLPLPASFEQAFDEAMDAFSEYYSRTGKKPLVMFSGGVDSLLIYLSLRRKINPANIRVATMDHSSSNGPARAYPVSRKLNFDLELYSLETLNSPTSRAAMVEMMRKEIVSARAPHIALASSPPCADILHGQNMDSMVNINMTVLQANLEKGLLSKAKTAEAVSDGDKLKQYETFLGNLQFTHEYLEDIELQRNTVDFYARRSRLAPFTAGPDGVICGMLSSQHPNLVSRSPFPKERNSFIRAEASKFKGYVGPRGLDNKYVVDLVRYATYAHLAGKRLSSLPLADGSRVNLVAMAGPIVSYCLGRRRGTLSSRAAETGNLRSGEKAGRNGI